MVVSGTTTDGNLITNLSSNEYLIISAYNKTSSWIFMPFVASSSNNWAIHIRKADGDVMNTNESVEVVVCYIPLT